jgi:phage replication O-like protein O
MPGFKSPRHTQTPNDLFDSLMAEMNEAELKVVLAAIRQTLGYHRNTDEISLTQFERMTGLSRETVVIGIECAIDRGVLREVGRGKRGVKRWELVIDDDQSENPTSQEIRPVVVGKSDQLPSVTSRKIRHTKEREEIKVKETPKSSNGKKLTKAQLAHARVTAMDENQARLYSVFTEQFGYQPEYDDDFETDITRLSIHGISCETLRKFIADTQADEWWKKHRKGAAVRVKYAADNISQMAKPATPQKPATNGSNGNLQNRARIHGLVGEVTE